MIAKLPIHSPLGASGADRWMNCPGSVNLIKALPKRDEKADPEYRTDGTAAHEAIAFCLSGGGCDAWEVIGEKFGDVKTEITAEIADAIQVFIDAANKLAAGADHTYVEARISSPDQSLFYGTVDFAAIKDGTLYILDYKHGQGIVVETRNNAQMMYYAYGLLREHPDVRRVSMQIIQPRIPHQDMEPWIVPAEDIAQWAEEKLFPAMDRTKTDATLCPGQWCRFCEAKANLACPALKEQAETMMTFDPASVTVMADMELAKLWPTLDTLKMHIKAIGDETLRRLMAGGMKENGVCKLVHKKANRVWKPEAAELFKSRFGDKVWNTPEFKTPAEMEKLDADAKKMVHEYAYTPQSGYTVAEIEDRRAAVVIKTAVESFDLDTIE